MELDNFETPLKAKIKWVYLVLDCYIFILLVTESQNFRIG